MNKYIGLVLFCLLLNTQSMSAKDIKESVVPVQVKAALKAKYPQVYVYEWEWKKKEAVYKAEFMMDGKACDAYFTPDGKWIRTKMDIKQQDLPPNIFQVIRDAGYGKWEIDDIAAIQSPEDETYYLIELEKGKQEVLLQVLPEGTIIKTINKH